MTAPAASIRDAGYSAPSAASVYALAEPDGEPLPRPTRCALEWDGRSWTETDPATGYTLTVGCVPDVHDQHNA